jgi:hypothetical protein
VIREGGAPIPRDQPILVERIVKGYDLLPRDPGAALAATFAAELLAPERAAEAKVARARTLRSIPGRDRAANLAKALALLDELAKLDRPELMIDGERAQVLQDLGRYEESEVEWARYVARDPGNWYAHCQHAEVLLRLRRPRESLVAFLRGISLAPGLIGRSVSGKQVADRIMLVAESTPGLAAAALAALADVPGHELDPTELRARARTLAAEPAQGDEEQDLIRYARVRVGLACELEGESRPFLALAAARRLEADDPRRAELIRGAAELDPLARAFVLLDPTASSHLR